MPSIFQAQPKASVRPPCLYFPSEEGMKPTPKGCFGNLGHSQKERKDGGRAHPFTSSPAWSQQSRKKGTKDSRRTDKGSEARKPGGPVRRAGWGRS